ncbi:MAG TPA: Uma2 family endonuclease [Longimicrobium sp.]|nr:Uma2 family endonuclease [Longimicrobium sp.]
MAVQFAQSYRFSEQQVARMADAGIIPQSGTELIDGVPYWSGAPVRFSRDAFYRLGELGVLTKRDRVERIDGEIIEMSPIGPRHSACVTRLNRFLTPRVGDAIVRFENPLALPEELDPQPDLVVVRPRDDDYEDGHPVSDDALLVIEVADSSLRYDRQIKAEWYAQAGIPEYWLVHLTRNQIAVHQQPRMGEYREVQVYGLGETWTSTALGGLEVPVNAILKRR